MEEMDRKGQGEREAEETGLREPWTQMAAGKGLPDLTEQARLDTDLDSPGSGPSAEARARSVPDGPHNRERYTERRQAVSLSLAHISALNTGCLSCTHLERGPITVRTEERRQGCVLWRGRQKGNKEILAPNISKFSRPTV